MDQKRLVMAIAISLAIMLGFQTFVAPYLPQPPPEPVVAGARPAGGTTATGGGATAVGLQPAAETTANQIPKVVPRVAINAKKLSGSISLLGARLDDVVLTDYRDTVAPDSPNVRLLEPRSDEHPYYVQYGWAAPLGETVKLPSDDTVWTAIGGPLVTGNKVTLRWDNGAGLTFLIEFAVDEDYLFSIRQTVRNTTGQPVKLLPWSRIRRDYKPETSGYYVLHEGLLGFIDGSLKETTYDSAKSDGEKKKGIALEANTANGWAGITDKYWLTAMIPDQAVPTHVYFRHIEDKAAVNKDRYQVDYVTQEALTANPGGEAALESHLFVGAKVVRLLDRYENDLHLPHFDKAVDFGYFYFLTKPIFFAIDYFNGLLGNFGLAIMLFTVIVKGLFFPLADYSYRSMSKMKLLAPKMAELRERYKDDPSKLQPEMMALYKAEKVNPASGCLPIVIQIPVFFSLYKVIFITIEMRQAPFFGWIKDLSVVDPTNLFNLFGLLPFDPTQLPWFGPYLQMGVWPLVMGVTMFLQQKLNPPPPDPMQARMFQLMPILFTFMMAGFPAGLIIYWSWNNLLSIGQQWLMMRRTRLAKPGLARV
ncbi:MAG: membrane protein insertase YidC [Acetobacteraceae bacterium]|nr:membrane protein insertase YidC [Acetobacteraceae bacterium]